MKQNTYSKLRRWLATGCLILCTATLQAQKTVDTELQARMMAKRAAKTDAHRQLLEIIEGVHIDSETVVRDFITERDDIRSRVRGVVTGAEETDVRYLSDGSVEVDMEVDVGKVRQALGVNFPYAAPLSVFRVTGCGVPNPVKPAPSAPDAKIVVEEPWYMKTIKATGAGIPPAHLVGTAQGKRMAERAALLDARRNLLEKVYGVEIRSETRVRDFVTESDKIESRVGAFLAGCYPVETRHMSDGSTEVDVEINLRGLRHVLPTETVYYVTVE